MSSVDFVCFGADWHGHPTSTHHLMRCIAREHRVLWVNSLGMRAPQMASAQDRMRLLKRGVRLLQHMVPRRTEQANLWEIDPMVLPLPGSAVARAWNRKALGRQLKLAMAQLGIRRPIVLTALPNAVELVPQLDPQQVIYYCLDDFTQMPGVDHEAIVPQEQALARLADLILISGDHLREHLAPSGTPIHALPHGVDLSRFSPGQPVHPLLHDIPGPRIGFFGAIDHWIDLELIAAVARARPQWHFPIIGPSRIPLTPWEGIDNIHILGPVPYDEVPQVAAGFDVGLLPFQVNDFTAAINPLKLREYFAAGLPAVSTSLPEVGKYRPLAAIADTPAETIAAIEQQLQNPPAQEALLQAVAAESWEARWHTLQQLLQAPMEHQKAA